MKILLLTNYYPDQVNPTNEIFITKRLEKMKQYGIDFDAFGMVSNDTKLKKILRIIFGEKRNNPLENVDFIENGVRYNYIHVKMGLLRYLSNIVNPIKNTMIEAKYLFKLIDLTKYDIIHAHCVYPEGYIAYLAKKKYKIPCVLTAHGSEIHTLPYTRPKLKVRIVTSLESADKVIFVSNALLQKSLEFGYSGNNAVVIPNGVDPKKFIIVDKTKMRKENGIYTKNSFYVGFVGNLIEVKRADKFIKIFLNISKNIPNVKFILIGDGSLRDTIQKESITNNLDVFFTGIIKPDLVPQWMNCMDCLILPSRNEGWGCVVLESQACGVPVVGSNAGGIPEAVGDGGLIVEQGNHFEERFSEAVCNILNNPPDPQKLRERALKYDWGEIVKQEIEVYQSLLQ